MLGRCSTDKKRSSSRRSRLWLPFLVVLLVAFLPSSCQNEIEPCYAGSEQFAPFLPYLVENGALADLKPLIRGNLAAAKDFAEKRCPVIFLTEPIEHQYLEIIEQQIEYRQIPFAREAIVIFTTDNVAETLSNEEIVGYYLNKTENVKPVTVVGHNTASDMYRFFRDSVLSGNHTADLTLEVASTERLLKAMQSNAPAIGYGRFNDNLPDGIRIASLSFGETVFEHNALEQTIANGEYPHLRTWYIYIADSYENDTKLLQNLNTDEMQRMLNSKGLFEIKRE